MGASKCRSNIGTHLLVAATGIVKISDPACSNSFVFRGDVYSDLADDNGFISRENVLTESFRRYGVSEWVITRIITDGLTFRNFWKNISYKM